MGGRAGGSDAGRNTKRGGLVGAVQEGGRRRRRREAWRARHPSPEGGRKEEWVMWRMSAAGRGFEQAVCTQWRRRV